MYLPGSVTFCVLILKLMCAFLRSIRCVHVGYSDAPQLFAAARMHTEGSEYRCRGRHGEEVWSFTRVQLKQSVPLKVRAHRELSTRHSYSHPNA